MEYVIVRYPQVRQRFVFIDGEKAGLINRLIRVGPGSHRFSLGEPQNYLPTEVELLVEGTNALQPAVIEFSEADL